MPTIKFSNSELHHISRMRKPWYEFNKKELLRRREFIKGKYGEPKFSTADCDKAAFIMALAGIGPWEGNDVVYGFMDTREYGNPFDYSGKENGPTGYFFWYNTLRQYSRDEQHEYIHQVVDFCENLPDLWYLYRNVKRSRTIILERLEDVKSLEDLQDPIVVDILTNKCNTNSWSIRRRKLLEKWNSMIPKAYQGPWNPGDPEVFRIYDAIKEGMVSNEP